MKLTLSLGQMDVILGEPAANLAAVAVLAAEARARGSDLLVLPELWSTGYDLANASRHATTTDSGIFAEVATLARRHQLAILGSCLSSPGPGQYRNTAVFVGPDGAALASYSKIHLFRLMDEDQFLTPGDHISLVETPWGPAGLSICYDLRFPELYRSYALAGAQMVFVPAEWPHPRLEHWRTLLRARAIENQLYVIACNRIGHSGDTSFFGHSSIIDPWGRIIVEAGEEPVLLTATIDLEVVPDVRRRIPVFADRRPELYGAPARASATG